MTALRERARKAAEEAIPSGGLQTKPHNVSTERLRLAYEEGHIAGAKAERVIALEEAARAVCERCVKFGTPDRARTANGLPGSYLHGFNSCRAGAIHALIASTREAEAGERE